MIDTSHPFFSLYPDFKIWYERFSYDPRVEDFIKKMIKITDDAVINALLNAGDKNEK